MDRQQCLQHHQRRISNLYSISSTVCDEWASSHAQLRDCSEGHTLQSYVQT